MSTFGFGLLLEGRWVLAVKAAAGLSDGDDVAGHRRIVFEFAAELGDARGDDPADERRGMAAAVAPPSEPVGLEGQMILSGAGLSTNCDAADRGIGTRSAAGTCK
jgi:hypothetical protein